MSSSLSSKINNKDHQELKSNQTSYQRLGLKVPLSLGTLQWGTTPLDRSFINTHVISDTEARIIVSEFTKAGVTLIDTAEGYGGGTSEKRVGRLVSEYYDSSTVASKEDLASASSSTRQNNDKKDEILLMTKFLPVPWRYSHSCFERAVRGSLERLKTDWIPIYLLHSPVHWRPIEYWVESASKCKHKGLIGALGLSNCNADQVRRAVLAGKKYDIEVVCNQVHYSLLDFNSPALREMEQTCRECNVTIVGYSPIGQGLLTNNLTLESWDTNRAAKMLRLQWNDIEPLRHCLEQMSKKYHKSMAQIAINWCICHDIVPLVGCRSQIQAQDTLGSLGWKLEDKDVVQLDSLALSKSTLESPPLRRMIFVTLAGIIMVIMRLQDLLGYGLVKEAAL